MKENLKFFVLFLLSTALSVAQTQILEALEAKLMMIAVKIKEVLEAFLLEPKSVSMFLQYRAYRNKKFIERMAKENYNAGKYPIQNQEQQNSNLQRYHQNNQFQRKLSIKSNTEVTSQIEKSEDIFNKFLWDDIRILGTKRGSSSRSSSRSGSGSRSSASGSGGTNSTNTTGGTVATSDLIIIILIPIIVVVVVIIIICICRRMRLSKQKVATVNNFQSNNQQDMNKQMEQCNPIQIQPQNQQQQVFQYPNQYGYNQQQLQVNQNTSFQQTNQEQSYLYYQQPAIQQASIL
ncbi:hypothetical protein ABPG74_020981 [Tetrahymena malaccensis]